MAYRSKSYLRKQLVLAVGRVIGSSDHDVCVDLAYELKSALRKINGLYDIVLAACRPGRPLGTILAREDYIDLVPRSLRTSQLITEIGTDVGEMIRGNQTEDDDNYFLADGECALTTAVSDTAHAFMATIATPEDLMKRNPGRNLETIARGIALSGPYLRRYAKLLSADHLLSTPNPGVPGVQVSDTFEVACLSDPDFASLIPGKVLREYYRRKSAE